MDFDNDYDYDNDHDTDILLSTTPVNSQNFSDIWTKISP